MSSKKKYNRGINVIEGLIKRAENTLKRANYHKSKQDTVPLEPLKNSCLRNIEALNKLNRKGLAIPDILYEYARKRMFEIYFALQEYRGPERQREVTKEVSLESIISLLDEHAVESYAADSRSGGLGFSSLSGATLYVSEAMNYNEYWKPPRKRGKITGHTVDSYGIIEHKPKQTIEAWREDMAFQKKEIMDELYRLQ
jgi:hypothetical protein